MENATKALLIAAAVLVAILIISLGLVVYNMAAETMSGINLNEAERMRFNSKFENFNGKNVSGTQVNSLVKTVFQHNLANDDANMKVSISGALTLTTGATSYSSVKADTGKTYEVECQFSSTTGLITNIKVTAK